MYFYDVHLVSIRYINFSYILSFSNGVINIPYPIFPLVANIVAGCEAF
jgi:hypothetical protein